MLNYNVLARLFDLSPTVLFLAPGLGMEIVDARRIAVYVALFSLSHQSNFASRGGLVFFTLPPARAHEAPTQSRPHFRPAAIGVPTFRGHVVLALAGRMDASVRRTADG